MADATTDERVDALARLAALELDEAERAALPAQLDQILHDVETGNVQVRAVTPELDEIPALLHQLAGRVTLAFFALALTLATAVIFPDPGAGALRIVLCILCGLGAAAAWTVLFWWHVVGRGKPLRLAPLLRFFRR